MPVLKKLDKTVKHIEVWQEECSKLQFALGKLLGESGGTSIADVAIAPPKDDEELQEAMPAGDVQDTDRRGRKVLVTPEGKTKTLTRAQEREIQRNGDGEGEDNGPETEHRSIEYTTPKPVIIKKTEDILKSDARLQELINKFYQFRAAGNVGKSDEMKTIVDEFVASRGLDPITVYASYNLVDKNNEFSQDSLDDAAAADEEPEEKPEEEPQEEPTEDKPEDEEEK